MHIEEAPRKPSNGYLVGCTWYSQKGKKAKFSVVTSGRRKD